MKKLVLSTGFLLLAAILPILAVFFSRYFSFSDGENVALLCGCFCLMIVLVLFGLSGGGVKLP